MVDHVLLDVVTQLLEFDEHAGGGGDVADRVDGQLLPDLLLTGLVAKGVEGDHGVTGEGGADGPGPLGRAGSRQRRLGSLGGGDGRLHVGQHLQGDALVGVGARLDDDRLLGAEVLSQTVGHVHGGEVLSGLGVEEVVGIESGETVDLLVEGDEGDDGVRHRALLGRSDHHLFLELRTEVRWLEGDQRAGVDQELSDLGETFDHTGRSVARLGDECLPRLVGGCSGGDALVGGGAERGERDSLLTQRLAHRLDPEHSVDLDLLLVGQGRPVEGVVDAECHDEQQRGERNAEGDQQLGT